MSDHLADTPVVIPPKCPGCYPDDDPGTFDTMWCETHRPPRDGADDAKINVYAYPVSASEASGQDNRLWCDALHRRKRLLTGG